MRTISRRPISSGNKLHRRARLAEIREDAAISERRGLPIFSSVT